MCGRYTLRLSPAELSEVFRLLREPDWQPRYNIAPTQAVPVLRPEPMSLDLSLMRWGLIPFWAKEAKIGARMINARAETVAEKPAFRSAFKRRRCLIPADGFYEWKTGKDKSKQPYLIGLKQDAAFAFAGLWERWQPPEGDPIESCTIITTEPNPLCAALHDRMPVILREDHYDRWLAPFPESEMQTHAVSTLVNNVKNEDPGCIDRVEPPQSQGGLFD